MSRRGKTAQIAGGLAHRVERSRYYREQFGHIARELRDRRIEGFPRYSEAVNRRLGGIYQLIDMIGGRYQRLQEKVALLTQQLRTMESLQIQDAIREQTAAALSLQNKIEQQTEAAVELQQTVVGLQRGAEIAFFLIALPYYFSALIIECFNKQYLEEHATTKWAIVALAVGLGVGLVCRKTIAASAPGHQVSRILSVAYVRGNRLSAEANTIVHTLALWVDSIKARSWECSRSPDAVVYEGF